MTQDEIVQMEAGREMDALVAELVMGWEKRVFGDGVDYWHLPGGAICELDAPHYSTDIAAAWQVVEKLPFSVYVEVRWDGKNAEAWFDSGSQTWEASAPTAPLAICRAALLAVQP
jgi:hypothetical protein